MIVPCMIVTDDIPRKNIIFIYVNKKKEKF